MKKKYELINLLKTLNYKYYQTECPYCGHPGTSTKKDNSDWSEVHAKNCDLLKIREAIQKN